MREPPLTAVPPGVVTVIWPLVFPTATTKVSPVSELTANDSTSTPFTFTADVPQMPEPLTVTDLPTALFFVNDLIAGTATGRP